MIDVSGFEVVHKLAAVVIWEDEANFSWKGMTMPAMIAGATVFVGTLVLGEDGDVAAASAFGIFSAIGVQILMVIYYALR